MDPNVDPPLQLLLCVACPRGGNLEFDDINKVLASLFKLLVGWAIPCTLGGQHMREHTCLVVQQASWNVLAKLAKTTMLICEFGLPLWIGCLFTLANYLGSKPY